MLRLTLRRAGHGLLLLLGVSLLAFGFTELAPGDFFDDMRLDPRISPSAAEQFRARYGLEAPLPMRYLRWLAAVVRGDLGHSFANNRPVAELLWRRAINTLVLTGSATLLAWLIAIPLGIEAAASRNRLVRGLFAGTTSTLLAIPDLVLGLLLLLLALKSGLFPSGGMLSLDHDQLGFWSRFLDRVHHLVLPVGALTIATAPYLARHVQASVAEVLEARFIRTARSWGMRRRRLLYRHALPAAANPLITLFGFSIASLLSASLLIEIVLGWPGVGPLLLDAILARDVYVVIGAVLASTLLLVIGNLIADLMLYATDPRIRRSGG